MLSTPPATCTATCSLLSSSPPSLHQTHLSSSLLFPPSSTLLGSAHQVDSGSLSVPRLFFASPRCHITLALLIVICSLHSTAAYPCSTRPFATINTLCSQDHDVSLHTSSIALSLSPFSSHRSNTQPWTSIRYDIQPSSWDELRRGVVAAMPPC